MRWKFWSAKVAPPPARKSCEELGSAKAPMHLRIPIVVTLKDKSELTPAKWAELRGLSRQKGHAPLVFVYENPAADGD